jgi:hypothetical protein
VGDGRKGCRRDKKGCIREKEGVKEREGKSVIKRRK